MSTKTSFAIRDYTLDPGEEMSVSRTSDFLMCLEASDTFKIAFEGESDFSDFIAGLNFSPKDRYGQPSGFNQVSIYNPSGATISVKLGFGKGDLKDARLNLSGAITSNEVVPDQFARVAGATFLDGVGGGILAADSTRKIAFIHNEGPGVFWLSESTSHGASGIPVFPAMTLPIETTASLVGKAVGGDVSYHITVTRFS